MKGGSPETGLAPRRSERRQKTTAAARWAADIVCQHGHVRKVPTGAGFPLAKNTEWEAKAEAGRMTRDPCNHLCRRRGRQTGSNVGTVLNSTNHRRKILFKGYEVFPAEQNCRACTLPRLDHQNFIEVYQNLSCRRPGSFQHNESGHSGLLVNPVNSHRVTDQGTP